ncbi:MAG: histidine kinase dimerization/phospho-acceptor domain-containing protein [Alphaproteobacteria bacterium]|nr:histidine kinase dimerization/phospho-acceptor domain-containing protein [Alphaproteobacteria bacterium]
MVSHFFSNRNFQRLELWLHRAAVSKKLFYFLVLAALSSGVSTYITFVRGGNSDLMLNLIILNVIVLILLVLLIASRLIKLFVSRRHGAAGARFHVRLVMVFSFLSITPTLVIYFMSSALFERGVQALVGRFTHDVVQESVEFSNNIRENLKLNMETLAKHISQDINHTYTDKFDINAQTKPILENIYKQYALKDLFILGKHQNIIFQISERSFNEINSHNDTVWDNLKTGLFIIYFSKDNTSIIAGYPLDLQKELFLFISQPIDSFLPKHFQEIAILKQKYHDIEQNRWQIRFIFMAIYGLFAFLSLLIAIGIGILLADHISQPIAQLVAAADKIRQGNLETRVKIKPNIIEFLGLAKAFNLMVTALQKQKSQLETANINIERRNNFIETTLKGLTSGVVGLDETNHIQVLNDAAANILCLSKDLPETKLHIADILPELQDLLYEQSALQLTDDALLKQSQKLIVIERAGRLCYLSVQISHTKASSDIRKVLTIDDITELHMAQKKAAWGDVARRVAHEIKNPLTPIQLSAERLKRKLLNHLPPVEQELFKTNIETIIRQVEEIERIVKEFSQFSRMPQLTLHEEDIVQVVKQCVGLQKAAYDSIEFKETYATDHLIILCDAQ